MCGICGVVDFQEPVERETIERMTDSIVHRGPDDSGIEMHAPAALGFRRLSIIDLAGSHQPMSNEDDSVWLLFNGEIYNFQENREKLLARGHKFKTTGDSETILHLYEDHDLDFVQHLNGMFGIALWDKKRRRLILARDRLGIKPIYYALQGGRLIFSSETKAILQAPRFSTTLDREALVGYMNYSSIPGEQTCFNEIRRLLPGHLAIFDKNGLTTKQYWDVHYDKQRDWNENELHERVEETLRDAVRIRMVSDVPLGAFLSGGVDSSLIAALMAEFSDQPVQAFSIGYGAEGAFMNELEYSKAVAERYGMNHHSLILDSEDLLRDIERVVWHLDEPNGDPAAFLTLALSEFTRKHVTVSLSGLGADELFGGYRRYLAVQWQHQYLKLPGVLRNGLIRPALNLVPEARIHRWLNYARIAKKFVHSVDQDLRTSWANTVSYLPSFDGPLFQGDIAALDRATFSASAFDDYWRRTEGFPSPVDRVLYMDMKMYMQDQLLMLQDKMSMAVSLEARVPFLDYRLVELAATIPASKKLAGGTLKTILKKIAEKYVPRDCIYRPKKGFAAPVEAWLKGPLREQVHDLLTPQKVRERGVFEPAFVEWMKSEFYGGGRDLTMQLYQAFLLEIWFQLYVDGKQPVGVPAFSGAGTGASR
ncbi:MAG: asparagine synthase (glutamine-hydrolyzing) [Bryobacterales bacterium]